MYTFNVSSIRNSGTPAGSSSRTPTGSTRATSGSFLFDLMGQKATSQAKAPDMLGDNGDPCHSDPGHFANLKKQLMSDTLGFNQQLVGNDPVMLQQLIHEILLGRFF